MNKMMFPGKPMEYRDFWQLQTEWEANFDKAYNEYCKSHSKAKKEVQGSNNRPKDRPGLCWEVKRDLVGWNKRKPERNKS